jgi:hypothetical protein
MPDFQPVELTPAGRVHVYMRIIRPQIQTALDSPVTYKQQLPGSGISYQNINGILSFSRFTGSCRPDAYLRNG